MGAALDHLAAVHDQDFLAVADGAQAMGHDDAGASAAAQAAIDEQLGQRIQGAGPFVQIRMLGFTTRARASSKRWR